MLGARRINREELEDLKLALNQGIVLAITDARGRILEVNQALCRLSGYSREELLGQDHRILNSGHHPKAFFQNLWATIQSGQIWRGEIRNRAKDGHVYWVDTVIVPRLGPDGKPVRYTSLRMDITLRKEAEALLAETLRDMKRKDECLRETQKLEALGVLAAGIAHDFNNILQAIRGHLEVAQLQTRAGTVPGSSLASITGAVERCERLLGQIRDYTGKAPATRIPLNLTALVDGMADLMQVAMPPGVHLEVDPGGQTLWVAGNRSQLEQVVLNLVVNAREALHPFGGLLRVRLERAILDGEGLSEAIPYLDLGPGPYGLLEVSDTGCGMDEATLSRIFEPYFTSKGPGRGLGLAALLGIVRAHGGGVAVRSSPGEGTTFRLFFPLVEVG